MDSKRIVEDPDVVSEVIATLAGEIKLYKAKVLELERIIQERRCPSCPTDEVRKKLERAESVEIALKFINGQVEDLKAENAELKVKQERESGVDKRTTSVKNEAEAESNGLMWNFQEDRVKEHVENVKNTTNNRERRQDLEQQVLHYKAKYKMYKTEVGDLSTANQELEDNVADSRTECKNSTRMLHAVSEENNQLKKENIRLDNQLRDVQHELQETSSKLTSLTSKPQQLHGYDDFCDYMQQFPLYEARPQFKELEPICSRNLDLKHYLAEDHRTLPYLNDALYLPGVFLWSSLRERHHGLGCGPAYMFNKTSSRWERSSQFYTFYGRSVELFFSCKKHIYYAGTYKCHNLRTLHEYGVMISRNTSYRAISDATSYLGNSSVTDQQQGGSKPKRHPDFHQGTIDQLYRDGILPVEYVGLQCVGYNRSLQNVMKERFVCTIPVPSKRSPPPDLHEENPPRPTKKRNCN